MTLQERDTGLTWTRAVQLVAGISDEAVMATIAAQLVDEQLDDVTRRRAAIDALVEEAKRLQRATALAIERAAEIERYNSDEAKQARADAAAGRAENEAAKQYQREQLRQEYERLGLEPDCGFDTALRALLNDYVASMKLEWTRELLATTFALKDGTRVTWGEATIAHHRERAEMFTDFATANLEGAARHRCAIRALEDAGAACLNDVAAAQATA